MFVKHANQNFSTVMKKINLHYTNLLEIFSLNPETLKPLETEGKLLIRYKYILLEILLSLLFHFYS